MQHFRLFILGFCAYASNVPTVQAAEIQGAYNVIDAVVPQLQRFLSVQFTPEGTVTAATLDTVPTPQTPI